MKSISDCMSVRSAILELKLADWRRGHTHDQLGMCSFRARARNALLQRLSYSFNATLKLPYKAYCGLLGFEHMLVCEVGRPADVSKGHTVCLSFQRWRWRQCMFLNLHRCEDFKSWRKPSYFQFIRSKYKAWVLTSYCEGRKHPTLLWLLGTFRKDLLFSSLIIRS
jgi:hypothetical protein